MRTGYRIRTVGFVVVLAVGFIVLGWRSVSELVGVARTSSSANLPFRNELTLDRVQPVSTFDPTQANPAIYDHVEGSFVVRGVLVSTLPADTCPVEPELEQVGAKTADRQYGI